jgi:hypothetical protein
MYFVSKHVGGVQFGNGRIATNTLEWYPK